jgi:dimethylglycine dehydrogenase
MAERYHQRFFKMVPLPDGTTFRSLTNDLCGFNVAGPKSRDVLQRLTNDDLTTPSFPFMSARRISVGGVEVIALRVSFTGDLGWELYCAAKDQVNLYTKLLEAAREEGGGPVGSRALMSLRIEKGYGSWGREYSPEYWPHEVKLDRLIKLEKSSFLNRDAYVEIANRPARDELVMMAIEANTADATGGEPIFLPDGTPIGQVTSGAYGYHVGMSLALGYVKAGSVRPGEALTVAILGQPHQAVLLERPPFDPDGQRLRA